MNHKIFFVVFGLSATFSSAALSSTLNCNGSMESYSGSVVASELANDDTQMRYVVKVDKSEGPNKVAVIDVEFDSTKLIYNRGISGLKTEGPLKFLRLIFDNTRAVLHFQIQTEPSFQLPMTCIEQADQLESKADASN